MMLQLVLVCCVVRWAAADDTLFFVPHSQLSKNMSCPDNTQCPVGNTCCPTQDSNQFGCCPYNNAVCCSDGVHCCQKGTECRPDGGGCVHPNSVSEQLKTLIAKSVLCPDRQGMCPNGQSCCEGRNGEYACCKFDGGVCCADKIHCCPAGLTCDLQAGRCVKKGIRYLLTTLFNRPLTRTSPVLRPDEGIKCSDGSTCPNGNTCCKMSTGSVGCCPLPKAFCCADGVHCCPSGTVRCDIPGKKCDQQDGSFVPWVTKVAAKVKDPVQCDNAHECPEGNTCCRQSSGQWGCCAIPQAVCCSDGEHCCQSGTTCDVTKGTCDRQDGFSVSWFKKTSAISRKVEDVVCPGGTSQCPDGNTCCKLSGGQWGCCPLPQAVCCSDGTHCCPTGTTCDVSQGKCSREDGTSLAWSKKTSSINRKVEDVVCPGGTSQCPDGNTCCKLSGGQWGCCPLPQAVCCSDGVHCCPSGTTCEVSTGKCNKQDGSSVSWFEKTLAIKMKIEMVKCDDTHECPDGNTCCKLSTGQWGCCPLPRAVCCSDGVHCCPSGTTCEVSTGKCNKQDGASVTWFEKTSAFRSQVENVKCPDGESECPDGNTCCKLSAGQWGCCPLPQAVCCPDGTHCCPSGTTCDATSGSCIRQDGFSMTWFEKSPALKKDAEKVICPDQTSECPDGSTCCKLSGGQFGCCPIPKAVCCSDGVHCCPSGTTCDVSQGKCNRGDGTTVDWMKKTKAVNAEGGIQVVDSYADSMRNRPQKPSHVEMIEEETVTCPGQEVECPGGSTCCKLLDDSWGCCPYAKASCCSDGVHCCPAGMSCNAEQGTCSKDGLSFSWTDKKPARAKKVHKEDLSSEGTDPVEVDLDLKTVVGNVKCSALSSCPDNQTCCPTSGSNFGCCPLPKGVCCPDHIHCCPMNTECSMTHRSCVVKDKVIPWLERVNEPLKIPSRPYAVMCPDGKSECPDGSTCCTLSSGTYGCCPLPDAKCCTDGVHCCPHGTTCDVAHGKCIQADGTLTLISTSTAASNVEMVRCPDGQSECEDGNTCCKLPTGQYGCCPLPKAVCCSDGVHCCPSGTTCEVSSGKCKRKDGISMTWFKKTSAFRSQVENVVCPGGQSECPDGNTCCKLITGQWGCCPLPQAVCCWDGTHCCPSGTTCEVSTGKCNRQDGSSVSWFEKTAAVQKDVTIQDEPSVEKDKVFFCNGTKKKCNNGQTCCPGVDGQYGCCVFSNGVCCSDGTHCCPSGTMCEVESGHCLKRGHILSSSMDLQEVHQEQLKDVQMIKCPDGTSECPDGNTCCKQSTGQYGCCPLEKAVCCSDGVHCCPSGTTCDVSQGKCNRQDGISVSWFKKTTAVSKKVEMVKCDESHECPDGNTCCKLSSGQFGCCPLPQAVCCSDGVHCCPSGTTCEVSTGKCNRQDGSSVTWFEKTLAVSRNVEDVVCPGGTSQCPDGNTCCKLSGGQYGCCPIPQAVCCSDGVHCCPSGTTCDVSQGTCSRQDGSVVAWLKKTVAGAIKQEVKDKTCEDGSKCPNGSSCCELRSGTYGCCPLPNAVCCTDGVHCCPQGYTCDDTSGTCSQGFLRIPFS